MLRRSCSALDSFKEHYHRVHLPRRIAFKQHCERQKASQSADTVPYKYNRWWVTNDHEFVHQFSVVEDPDVTLEKRRTLPPVTKEDIWKEPQRPSFLPFSPFVHVAEYKSDPDAKFMKPINIPRWKDYMQRTKPVVPRTWY